MVFFVPADDHDAELSFVLEIVDARSIGGEFWFFHCCFPQVAVIAALEATPGLSLKLLRVLQRGRNAGSPALGQQFVAEGAADFRRAVF